MRAYIQISIGLIIVMVILITGMWIKPVTKDARDRVEIAEICRGVGYHCEYYDIIRYCMFQTSRGNFGYSFTLEENGTIVSAYNIDEVVESNRNSMQGVMLGDLCSEPNRLQVIDEILEYDFKKWKKNNQELIN